MRAARIRRFLQGGRLLVVLAGLVVFALLLTRFAATLYVDVLWFEAVEYLDVFWTRTLWQWGVRLLAGVVTAGIIFWNLRIVASTLGAIQIKRRVGDLEIAEKLPRSYIVWATAGIAVLVGFWFGAALPEGAGVSTLVFLRAPEWGVVEPFLDRDLSFYVFILPMLRALLAFFLVLAFFVASLCAAGYGATGSLGWSEKGLTIGKTARIHLASLLAAFLVLLAFEFWIGQFGLLLDGNSDVQGIFGYADARARIPGHQLLAGVTVACAAGLIWGAIRGRATVALASVGVVVVGGVALLQLYPAVVQRFQVEPNELARETPYIEQNLAFTRMGFGVDDLERRSFEYAPPSESLPTADVLRQLDGLPVWTDPTLLTTFREVEARFRYYQFPQVVMDRYPSDDGIEMLAVSARQIDPGSIEDPNWQNLHLRRRYIAGQGAVVSSATKWTNEGRPRMYVTGIPPQVTDGSGAPEGLRLTHPAIYFGSQPQLYAILNAGEGVFSAPGGTDGEEGVDFPRGILLDSPLRTVAMAWSFRDANLLFASEISDSSRVVVRRQVQQRVEEIAPFLEYFAEPYPVIHGGRVYWIQDAFTATRNLPLSSAHETPQRRTVNYIRNSVKITVDAVTGRVRFYAVSAEEPLLQAYSRAFPGMFLPLEEMPEGLRRHTRYPRSLLDMQAVVLQQYHQETASRFHAQLDVWSRPQELAQGSRSIPYGSQYAYYRLPGDQRASFLLTTVFVPLGRQNLTGILAARGDPERYGELVLLDVTVEDQVPGPRQVEALVEQDPLISEQFSLWRTGGSQVWTGHLHLVPVAGSLLYMEPIFLAADEDAIPELRRIVLSDGQSVVMRQTFQEALTALSTSFGPSARPSGGAGERTPSAGEATGEGISGGSGAGAAGAASAAERADREWSGHALELLDSAELRLRRGDWNGFGGSLDRLRSILEEAESRPDSGGGVP